MSMERISYGKAREIARPGDVVAFGGSGLLSKIIKVAGNTVVSHAGVIVAPLNGDEEPQFLESTIRLRGTDPVLGAKITALKNRWDEYVGDVWLLRLGTTIRTQCFDEKRFIDFAAASEGKLFDIPEGLGILIKELLEQLVEDRLIAEQYYFCSELVARAFVAAGTLPKLDPSDVSPKDLCRWKMYDDTYYLRDEQDNERSIRKFNSLPVGATLDGTNERARPAGSS